MVPVSTGAWRRARGVALALVVTLFPVWALARLGGLERGFPAVQLMAFTPYAAVAAVVVAIGALLCRRWAAGALAALAAAALVAAVVPRALPDGSARPDGPVLRVLSANLLAGAGDERAVLDLARRLGVDVLAIQEFTPSDARGLDAAGVADLLPHRAAYPKPGVVGSALFSRHLLRDGALRVQSGGVTQARATVEVPGAPTVDIESVHPQAPGDPAAMSRWQRDLANQPAATVEGRLRILVGDFNATLDHAALRRLIDTGYRDAAEVVGAGLRPTWPYDERTWFIPGVTLDRVLADRRIGVRAARPYPVPGSDHRAFYAELVLPRDGRRLPVQGN